MQAFGFGCLSLYIFYLYLYGQALCAPFGGCGVPLPSCGVVVGFWDLEFSGSF